MLCQRFDANHRTRTMRIEGRFNPRVALLANFGRVVLADFGSSPVSQPTVARLDRRTRRGLESQSESVQTAWWEHEFGIGTIAGLAAKRQAMGNALRLKH